ncbi:MAG TPA: RDD family protein, partial [Gemmatimonadales bacterium]|nr:RDD family protein [Gemmatimonadales bacterium]
MNEPQPRRPRDFRQHLEVETPEHVVLDLEIAGVGSRLLAAVIDTAILGGLIMAMAGVAAVLMDAGLMPTGRWIGLVFVGWSFVVWMGYHVFFEGFRRGQTPGKAWVGLRVVRDTGHPITAADAMTRNLLRLADFLPPPYLGGLLLMALHPLGKRLGDLAAGTVVIRDQPMATAAPQLRLDATAPAAAPVLADHEFGVLAQFVARAGQLEPEVLSRLAGSLADRFAPHLPAGGNATARLTELHRRETERRRGPLAGTIGVRARFAARQAARWNEFRKL